MLAELARQTYADAYAAEMASEHLQHNLVTHLSNQSIAEMFRDDIFLLAMHDETAVGFLQYGVANKNFEALVEGLQVELHDIEIRRVYVLSSMQNMGLGEALMCTALTAITDACTLKSLQVLLNVWETNYGAQKFYQRYGFEKIGVRPEYNPNGDKTGNDYIFKLDAAIS